MIKSFPETINDLFCYECKQFFKSKEEARQHRYVDADDNLHIDVYHNECVNDKINRLKKEGKI